MFVLLMMNGFWHIVIDSDEGVMEALSGRC